jgi:hypothetical protein
VQTVECVKYYGQALQSRYGALREFEMIAINALLSVVTPSHPRHLLVRHFPSVVDI